MPHGQEDFWVSAPDSPDRPSVRASTLKFKHSESTPTPWITAGAVWALQPILRVAPGPRTFPIRFFILPPLSRLPARHHSLHGRTSPSPSYLPRTEARRLVPDPAASVFVAVSPALRPVIAMCLGKRKGARAQDDGGEPTVCDSRAPLTTRMRGLHV